MAIFNQAQNTPGIIIGNVQQTLKALQKAFDEINDVFGWSSGVSQADLVAVGFVAGDATALLTAINDAHAEYVLRTTGLPPSTYPQPASVYVYAQSQNAQIG